MEWMASWSSRMEELRAADSSRRVFGSGHHEYAHAAPVSEKEVQRIENQYGFEVPGEYRQFLTEIGNGGAGPGYGLWPIGFWDPTDSALEEWSSSWADNPGHSFPHAAAWNLPESVWKKQPPSDANYETHDDFTAVVDAAAFAKGLANGAIPIANLGCAIRVLLVVSGPQEGQVWIDDRASDGGIYPAPGDRAMTFVDVYEDWLARAEQQVSSGKTATYLW